MRRLVPLFAVFVIAVPAIAQEPVPGDTTGRDTTGITQLPQLNVTVTRSPEPLARVPFAVGVLDRDDLVRGQPTLGIDEALNNLPGVVVANVELLTTQSAPALSWRNSAALCCRNPSALNCDTESVPLTSPERPDVQLCHL